MNNACNISTAIALSEAGAEVVGSHPTRSIIIFYRTTVLNHACFE
jgi:hypothetical protein